jgi:hypothetical protein
MPALWRPRVLIQSFYCTLFIRAEIKWKLDVCTKIKEVGLCASE